MNSDVTLDQALANLRSGGLTGSALTGAEAALRGYYANRPASQGTAYTPPQAGNTQAITPTSLTTQNPFILPTARPTTSANGFMAELEGYQSTADALVPRDTQLENNQAQVQQTFFDRLLGRKGQNELTNEAYSKDVDPAKKELDEIQNTIRAKSLAARREVEALQKNGAMTKEQAAAFINEANRKNTSELADLSVIEQAKLQNYDTAKSIADRKVAVEMERDNQQLEALKFFYTENKEKLTKAEDRRFQIKLGERERKLDDEKDRLTKSNELVLEAARSNAPASVLQAMQNVARRGGSVADVINASGGYLVDQKRQLELEKLRQEVSGITSSGGVIDVEKLAQQGNSSYDNNTAVLGTLFKSNKITAANKTAIGNAMQLAQAASELVNASQQGAFSGLYPGRSIVDFFTPAAFKRAGTVSNESLISALDLQTQFWASGAALTEAQTKLVQKMIPTKNDTDKAIKAKTNQLVNYMLQQTASRLLTDGIQFKPQKVNLFEVQDWISGLSPQQRAQLQAEGLI